MTDALLPEIVRALELALIERLPGGGFTLLAPAPDWLDRAFERGPSGSQPTLGAALPFLEYFLPEAETAWRSDADADSGPFTARLDGEDVLLRARARTIGGRAVLVIDRLTGHADARPILQTAREQLLAHEGLVKQAAAVHAPLVALEQAATAVTLQAGAVAGAGPAFQALTQAIERLRQAVAPLPQPPPRRRGGR